jgi:2-methylfumaryl-CoA isomerase
MIIGLTRGQWRALVEVTGTADVFTALAAQRGLDFENEGDRYAARDAITAILAPWFSSRTLEQIEADLAGRRVLWAPYRTMDEVAADLAARSDSVVQYVDQPDIGPVLTARSPLRWNGHYTAARPAPRHGQHTDEVLGADQLPGTR